VQGILGIYGGVTAVATPYSNVVLVLWLCVFLCVELVLEIFFRGLYDFDGNFNALHGHVLH
jgi:hypothetical protein